MPEALSGMGQRSQWELVPGMLIASGPTGTYGVKVASVEVESYAKRNPSRSRGTGAGASIFGMARDSAFALRAIPATSLFQLRA